MDPSRDPAAFWNQAYGDDTYRYGTSPNAFVVESAVSLPTGARVLVIGDGEGRNGVWLAEQGHAVVTVEPSEAGVTKARRLAGERGVAPEIRQGLFPAAVPETAAFDAVVLTFIHVPPDRRAGLHAAAIDRLAPGGVVILEAFRPEQRTRGRTSGGPPDAAMMFTEAQLREDFQELVIDHLSTPTVTLREGPGHDGEAEVIRLVARRA